MAVQPIIVPRFRAFDADGDPLAGGLLYSYEAGTSTPLATYTTRAGSVANANPVVLDANGEADVWVTGGVLYKFVLKDSEGVTQWTADNVPSAGADALFPDGNVSAPGIAFSNDPNTGAYRPAADQYAIAAGGAQSALFKATGVEVPGTFKSVGGLSADLPAGGFKVTGLGAAVDPNDAVRKAQLDAVVGAKAWARIQTNGAGGISILASQGVSGVHAVDADRIYLKLTTPPADNFGVAVATLMGVPADDRTVRCEFNISASELRIAVYDIGSAAAVAPSTTILNISVVLFWNT